ncbi:phosphotransferase [Nonomuraea maheshkhaliensis]|uniref:Phosphotransferase n=2 Tax=Nonomuraea maheshkhaliensis TaxID=419590 RepID=A0ABN2EI05_9ACTN
MTGERRFVGADDVAPLAREVFGPGRTPVTVQRVRGGTSKGVYRLSADDGRSAILYVWSQDEDFWRAPSGQAGQGGQGGQGGQAGQAGEDGEDGDGGQGVSGPPDGRGGQGGTVGEPSGLELFEASRTRFEELGVRVPRLLIASRAGEWLPSDAAVVEDLRGGTLEARLLEDPEGAAPMMDRLAESLRLMSTCRAPRHGRVAEIDHGGPEEGDGGDEGSCPGVVLRWSLKDLREAAGRVGRIAAERDAFEAALRDLHAAVRPRPDHGLIHGELGPDHILLDDRNEPVLIDIEGASYFDVEWEHVFLKIRFGDHYGRLRPDGLDERRLRFYRLAHHLSLVAGPLRLLDGDFPDRDFMTEIATHHTEEALTFLRTLQ